MKTFKSPEDLSKLSPDDPSYPLIKELVSLLIEAYTYENHPYLPDDYGYIILIEEADVDAVIPDVGCQLIDVFWEGAFKRKTESNLEYYNAIFLANDEYGLTFVIPDKEWVKGDLRSLLDELVGY